MATKTMTKPKSTAAAPAVRRAKPRSVDVLEFLASPPRVDKEKGIAHGVRILGRISKNGHRYSDDAIRAGRTIYDGAVVNLDHPPERNATAERAVRDRFGVMRSPVVQITGNDETDGVYADHHFPLAHSYTPEYLEILERFPHTVGFSHNAVVTESVHDGKVIFNSIERVRSVDLVANPATTRGVFESEGCPSMEDDPNLAADPNAAAATEDTTEPTTDEQMCAALKMAVNAILDDDDMSVEDKKKKISTLMDAHDDTAKGDTEEDDAAGDSNPAKDDEGGKKAADDTASLKDRLSKLEQELKARNTLEAARELLEKAGLRPVKWQVKAFSVLEGEDERKAFIADAQKTGGQPTKPRSTSVNALESQRTAGETGKAGVALAKTQDELQSLTYELMRP